MSETTIVALAVAVIAAFPPTLVAYLALSQSRANAKKADQTAVKVDQVHVLANSNLSQVNTALAVANEKILGLEKLLTQIAKRRPASAIPKIRDKN